jgi:hypothetical protein
MQTIPSYWRDYKMLEDEKDKRDDAWLMIEEYKKNKSRFHCKLCEKTHTIKDCPNKKKEEEIEVKKSQYSYNDF